MLILLITNNMINIIYEILKKLKFIIILFHIYDWSYRFFNIKIHVLDPLMRLR